MNLSKSETIELLYKSFPFPKQITFNDDMIDLKFIRQSSTDRYGICDGICFTIGDQSFLLRQSNDIYEIIDRFGNDSYTMAKTTTSKLIEYNMIQFFHKRMMT